MPAEHINDFAGTYGDGLPEWLERAALGAGMATTGFESEETPDEER